MRNEMDDGLMNGWETESSGTSKPTSGEKVNETMTSKFDNDLMDGWQVESPSSLKKPQTDETMTKKTKDGFTDGSVTETLGALKKPRSDEKAAPEVSETMINKKDACLTDKLENESSGDSKKPSTYEKRAPVEYVTITNKKDDDAIAGFGVKSSVTLKKPPTYEKRAAPGIDLMAMPCVDSFQGWCIAHGLKQGDMETLMMVSGAESYHDLFELDSEEKEDLLSKELRMKMIPKKRVLKALDSRVLSLFLESVDAHSSVEQFKKQMVDIGRPDSTVSENHIKPKDVCAFVHPSIPKDVCSFVDLEKGGMTLKQKDTIATSPKFAPGVHVIPHKLVVLDQAKAMKDNPTLKQEDFTSLDPSTLLQIPRGGRLVVILVVGPTGSGKTTTINSMVNYLYGVKYEDKYRLKLITEPPTESRRTQSQSQTDQVIGYLIDSPPALGGKDWILIIDSPGLGDSRGVARDKQTGDELKAFFETKINYLNAVCFVNQGPNTRLTFTQKWVFDKILSFFGKEIQNIITVLFTFCDAKKPPALQVILDADIRFKEYFKLNNSAYFLDQEEEDDCAGFNKMFWDLGNVSFKAFFSFALDTKDHGLEGTRAVLDSREKLENTIENVRKQVDDGIFQLQNLEKIVPNVITAKALIDSNKDFEFEVTEHRRVKKPKQALYNTVCIVCQWTCHEDCIYENNNDKMRCCAMRFGGYCGGCPKKCHWTAHKNLDYFYELEEYKVKKTNQQLKERYVNASSDKSKYEQIMDGLKKDFNSKQDQVYQLALQVKSLINELQKIALRPNLFHRDEYFDLMIEQERKEKKSGWSDRIKMIESLKKRSKYLHDVSQDNYDPFNEVLARITEQASTGKVEWKIGKTEGRHMWRWSFFQKN